MLRSLHLGQDTHKQTKYSKAAFKQADKFWYFSQLWAKELIWLVKRSELGCLCKRSLCVHPQTHLYTQKVHRTQTGIWLCKLLWLTWPLSLQYFTDQLEGLHPGASLSLSIPLSCFNPTLFFSHSFTQCSLSLFLWGCTGWTVQPSTPCPQNKEALFIREPVPLCLSCLFMRREKEPLTGLYRTVHQLAQYTTLPWILRWKEVYTSLCNKDISNAGGQMHILIYIK